MGGAFVPPCPNWLKGEIFFIQMLRLGFYIMILIITFSIVSSTKLSKDELLAKLQKVTFKRNL